MPFPIVFKYALLFGFLAACSAPIPSEIPQCDLDLVVVKAVRLPDGEPWYSQFADHCWIDFHEAGDEKWTRVEANTDPDVWSISPAGAFNLTRWGRDVEVLAILKGSEAAKCIPLIRSRAEEISQGFGYRAFPGPNSNTFIARILTGVPGLSAELTHNSVGKDYTPLFSAGWTASSDGFFVDTPILGASLGFCQGVELHIIGLTAGLSIWPPAIKLPILPRIGFEPGTTRMPKATEPLINTDQRP